MQTRTDAEKSVYRILTALGYHVIRQFPIKTAEKLFFADLYIPSLKLVLEIDGGYHYTEEQKRRDRNRSACMRRLGYHIYRMSNRDAYNPAKVRARILAYRTRSSVKAMTYTSRAVKRPETQGKTLPKIVY